MLRRKPPRDIAKVGVEGSNPFARSNFPLSKIRRPFGVALLLYVLAV